LCCHFCGHDVMAQFLPVDRHPKCNAARHRASLRLSLAMTGQDAAYFPLNYGE
jgi:hypothetical protein